MPSLSLNISFTSQKKLAAGSTGSALLLAVAQKSSKGSKKELASEKSSQKALVFAECIKKDTALEKWLTAKLSDRNFQAEHGKTLSFLDQEALKKISGHDHLIVVGLGQAKEHTTKKLLSIGGKLGLQIKALEIKNSQLWVDSFWELIDSKQSLKDHAGREIKAASPSSAAVLAEHLCVGAQLALYKDTRFQSKKEQSKKASKPYELEVNSLVLDAKQGSAAISKANHVSEGVYLARDLQNAPGNKLYPELIAEEAKKAAKAAGNIQVKVWDEKKLKSEGMGGILAVGQGSINPPRFIIMEYKGAPAGKKAPTLVLVGKGISFDTGGVSLKPAAGMEDMKYDMSGAASVIGAIYSLAKLKAKLNVVVLVPSAENMNSGSAIKPGDVYTAYDGKTVEVLNTDAEGRLVLADALSYAKSFKPDCVIDVATLTGAVLVALGDTATGVLGNNAEALDRYKEAALSAGELSWELPIFEEYEKDMKSSVADLRNIGTNRLAGTATAAAFLNAFVEGAYPWVHLDVAGTAMSGRSQGAHCPDRSGTGIPTRSLIEYALHL